MNTYQVNSPNMWIADTTATVHMTPYCKGLENMKKTAAEAIDMGNGSTKQLTEVADLIRRLESNGKMIQI